MLRHANSRAYSWDASRVKQDNDPHAESSERPEFARLDKSIFFVQRQQAGEHTAEIVACVKCSISANNLTANSFQL
jgi:hypothetical protein